jgi:hypothetical protein
VLVWGQLPSHTRGGSASGGTQLQQQQAAPASSAGGRSSSSSSSSSSWGEVTLPAGVRVTHIAAGQQHLLMSDGWRVWCVGRWMDQHGEEAGCTGCEAPTEVLALPGGAHGGGSAAGRPPHITRLAAGMHSSAAVDSAGQLWLWGRLLDEAHSRAITRGVAHIGGGGSSSSSSAAAVVMQRRSSDGAAGAAAGAAEQAEQQMRAVDWAWAGFGGARPRVVPGLSGVRDVALGGWHALVLVD